MNYSRHQIRVGAVILVYQSLMRDDPAETLYQIAEVSGEFPYDENVRLLTDSVLSKSKELDEIIQQHSPRRALQRIPKLLRAIMQVAIYEITYDEKVPVNAAISEALAICEEFSYFPEDVRFLNGLLGAYARGLNKESIPDGTQT